MGDTALSAKPVSTKVSFEIIDGKGAYDAFTETVVLTEIMRQ